MEFKYKVVLFTQPGCPACELMKVTYAKVAGEIHDEYPELEVGFGQQNVLEDGWEFLDSLSSESGEGTPEIAVFNAEAELIGFNGAGILAHSELKSFILNSIK